MALLLDFPASAAEGSGVVSATVTRTGTVTSALTVFLSSSDTTEATVPVTVVIPASQASASFNLNVVDDNVVDGTKMATINAVASGHAEAFKSISITDNDLLAGWPGGPF
jgi:hypothetical protein